MTTKEYLSQISRLNKMIAEKAEEIQHLESLATNITRGISETGGVKTSGAGDKIGNAVVRIIDDENEMEALLKEYLLKRKTIISQIDTIQDERLYEILTARYVRGKEWYMIASDMGYTIHYTMNMHKKALEVFENAYGDMYLA